MKNATLLSMVAMVVASLTTMALAQPQVEPIGPMTLGPQQTFVGVYPNFIPPNPLYKELQFTGTASVPPGAISDLFVEFDFLDQNGSVVVVPAPLSTFTVFGGAPAAIDTGILTLMFCPTEVSLHLTNHDSTGVPMQVVGSFRHECFSVPEPMCLSMIGALALMWIRCRRGKAEAVPSTTA